MTAPERFADSQIPLAPRAPSIHGLPNLPEGRAILERRLGTFKFDDRSWESIEPALKGLSQAELVRAADAVVKDAILEGAPKVSPEALCDALKNRQTLSGKFRRHSGR